KIGDGLHVNDLRLPEGVEVPPHVNYSVVSVVAPQKEEEVQPVAAAPTAEVPATAQAPAAAPAEATPAAGKGKAEK
ncbi:MAG: 50S ribosomal protein L25, partial [Deltaproteobacteria bacterium]|nr:50S ribosomal protein L25 [Deltaproteobacteria bacterium]